MGNKFWCAMSQFPNLQCLDEIPEASVLLDLWLDHSSEGERRPIGMDSDKSYRYFWNTWLNYLNSGKNGSLSSPVPWHEVTAADVASFLQTGPRGRKANTDPTLITKRRYWRLLERIYAFAQQNSWIRSNPAAQLIGQDVPPPEDPRGYILTPQMWEALQFLLKQELGSNPLKIRNQAICQTLFELGLMPVELRMLKISSLVFRQKDFHDWALCAIQVDGDGVGQYRKLPPSPFLADRLLAWRKVRERLRLVGDSDVLFCSRAGKILTPMQLINIVSEFLRSAAQHCQQPPPPRMGPQVVRNTRLVMWLNSGQAPSQVAVWAGLKDVHGLYHLRQHVNPDVQLWPKQD